MESEPYHFFINSITNYDTTSLGSGWTIGICLLILLFTSALISGSEVAYFSLSTYDMDQLRSSGNSMSRLVLNHLQTPDRLLATLLVSSSFIHVGIVVVSTFAFRGLFLITGSIGVGLLLQVILITLLILFFSDILPKILATRFAKTYAQFSAIPVKFFKTIFWPLSGFLLYSTQIVNKRFLKYSKHFSINELSDALDLTETQLDEEKNILKGIVKFGNIDVCEIMKSRVDVVSVDIQTSYHELLKTINESGYSRIPVYEETFDQINGILFIKDLLPHLNASANFNWQVLIRPSFFVPESKKINDLLKEFQTNRNHMAIVVDEYGGTSGIITMEDILEEIVGEITDESDEEELPYEKIDENNFIFEGKTLLNDFFKIVNVSDDIFDTVKGEADTLAGLILELKGEIPKPDEKQLYKNFIFTIVSVDKRRIKKIKVTFKPLVKN